jgi:hypothetical protein
MSRSSGERGLILHDQIFCEGVARMARKPKTDRVPRTRAGNQWTEASFWAFIRSGFRQLSQRWPPIHKAAEERRRPNESGIKKFKWQYQCDCCEAWYYRKEVQVDHIVPCGTLKSFADLSEFADRLFCESSGLRVLCVECHQKRKSEV